MEETSISVERTCAQQATEGADSHNVIVVDSTTSRLDDSDFADTDSECSQTSFFEDSDSDEDEQSQVVDSDEPDVQSDEHISQDQSMQHNSQEFEHKKSKQDSSTLEKTSAEHNASNYGPAVGPVESPDSNTSTPSNEQSLAENFDHENSELIKQFYGSDEAQDQQSAIDTATRSRVKRQSARRPSQVSISKGQIKCAVRFDQKLDMPVANSELGTEIPHSPGHQRAKQQAKKFAELPYVPSLLGTGPPNDAKAETSSAIKTEPHHDQQTTDAAAHVAATLQDPNAFQRPREAPTPAKPVRHRRSYAVNDAAISPRLPKDFEFPASTQEVVELTGMKPKDGLAAAAAYHAKAKSTSGEHAAVALKTQRSLFNFNNERDNSARAAKGQMPARGTSRLPESAEERAELSRALLHEYHGRYTRYHKRLEEADRKVKQLRETEAELMSNMAEMEDELNDAVKSRRTMQTDCERRLGVLQTTNDNLLADVQSLQQERDESRGSVVTLQKALDERVAICERSEAQIHDLKASITHYEDSLAQHESRTAALEAELEARSAQDRQLEQKSTALQDQVDRLAKYLNGAHDIIERLREENAGLQTANQTWERRSAVKRVPSERTQAPRRPAWRRDGAWRGDLEMRKCRAMEEDQKRAEYEYYRDYVLDSLKLPSPQEDSLAFYQSLAGRAERRSSRRTSQRGSETQPRWMLFGHW